MTDADSRSAVVLVVDDDRHVADAYADQLRRRHSVRVAYTGESALEQLDGDVDVVLLDRKMPDLSGDEVLATARTAGFTCRIAMVTGMEPDFDIIELGFDDYVTKPVTESELFDVVERLLVLETFDEQLQALFADVSTAAALECEKNRSQLAASEEYATLRARIDRLEARIDEIRSKIPEEALLRVALADAPRDVRQHS